MIRRPGAGVVALAVTVPLLAAVMIAAPILERAQYDPEPVSVPAGTTAREGGLEVSVRAAGEFPSGSGSIDLPAGAAIVAVVVDIAPTRGERATACFLRLSAPGPDGRVEWLPEDDVTRYGYARGGDEFSPDCDVSVADPSSIEAVFLAPVDVIADAALDVTLQSASGRSRTLRMELPEPE
ncbi:hypothetical protein [Rathayibacter sp. VKM Ac-2801]|uniref:hypothetical protein n=1 Tax=Rathayibacter sp. VKM Ac-2801 TaxID=2609255 RepID=UPI0013203E70|nr:hypothetical protein [Rathayibacter sp. VKM Ac-2801]QHC71836.1 hypothetical protein GSU45_16530 [Rathayibacter sp. VKM Ac-2801]